MSAPEPKDVVLAFGDTHYPFSHRDHLDFLDAVIQKHDPTLFVHTGDELDFHALSDYDSDPDGDSAGVEYKKGIKEMKKLYSLIPSARACISNHNARPYRRAYKSGIPTAFMRTYAEWMQAPEGWEWGFKFDIDGVVYEHGEGVSGKLGHLKAAEQNMQSTVIGHIHAHAGVAYLANPKHLIFGLNCGWLGDKDAYSMAYGRNNRNKPILGASIIDHGIPTFIPMVLRKGGRWVGRV